MMLTAAKAQSGTARLEVCVLSPAAYREAALMFPFQVPLLVIRKSGSGVFFLLRGLYFVGVSKVGGKLPMLFV